MPNAPRTATVTAWAVLALALPLAGRSAPTPEETRNIEAAAPEKPSAAAAQPRKLLVFTLCRGERAEGLAYASEALRILGRKTGAFDAVVSDDPAMFEPDALKQFDAVCLNNTTGELFLPDDLDKLPPERQEQARQADAGLKKSFMAFLAAGKGLVALHAAAEAFPGWAEFGKALGGWADGRPWDPGRGLSVRVEDPTHPLCAAFDGRDFQVDDSVYQIKAPYFRLFQRVLLTVDTGRTEMPKEGIRREDGDFAVSWVRKAGKGTVFYFGFGRRKQVYWNPALLRHLLDGVQFALGDLPAETAPIPSLVEIEKMANACPDAPLAPPARPRKLLVFKRYGHTYGHYTSKALEVMGRKTGAFEAVVSDDVAMFEPEKLKQFDAVFLNQSNDLYLNPKFVYGGKAPAAAEQDSARQDRLRQSLFRFVADGGGLCGVHASAGGSPEFKEMIGGSYHHHPWYQKVWIKLDDPGSPLCRGFGRGGFEAYDEIYQFHEPQPPIRSLMSVDTTRTVKEIVPEDSKDAWKNKDQPDRKDNFYSAAWIRGCGKGRVFYTTFGHHFSTALDANILRLYLNGIQFALGDLPAETAPNACLPASQPADP